MGRWDLASLLLKSSPEIIVAGLTLWLRVNVLHHTTYGGPNGDDDPEAGVVTALRHLVTGDPDRGGHRKWLKYIPSLAPMSHYSDRFLARVLQAFVIRTIAMSASTADADDPLWDEVHLPRSGGRVFRPTEGDSRRERPRVEGSTLCEQMLSYVSATAKSDACHGDDSVLSCYQNLLSRVPSASKRELQAAFRSADANASCADVAVPSEGRSDAHTSGPRTRPLKSDALNDLTQTKWVVDLADVERFLRMFITSIAQTSPKVWRSRIDMSDRKLRRIIRLAVRHMNETDCLDATLLYDVGNTEATHQSMSIGRALPGHANGLAASATVGKTRTRHRKVVSGFKIVFFDKKCVAKITAEMDKALVTTMRDYPNEFLRILDDTKSHWGTAAMVVAAILGAKTTKSAAQRLREGALKKTPP